MPIEYPGETPTEVEIPISEVHRTIPNIIRVFYHKPDTGEILLLKKGDIWDVPSARFKNGGDPADSGLLMLKALTNIDHTLCQHQLYQVDNPPDTEDICSFMSVKAPEPMPNIYFWSEAEFVLFRTNNPLEPVLTPLLTPVDKPVYLSFLKENYSQFK